MPWRGRDLQKRSPLHRLMEMRTHGSCGLEREMRPMLSHAVSQMGRHKEARLLMEGAFLLEPLSPLHQAIWSQVSFQARDHEHAAERARRAIVLDPEFWVGYMMLGQASEQLGETDIALDALTTATRLSAGNSKPIALRGYILARTGQIRAAREMIDMFDELS